MASLGTAFKRVRTILVVEKISEVIGLNHVASLGVGFHPACPSITISRVAVLQWAGLTDSQYRTGCEAVREVRRAVEVMERAVFRLSDLAERDHAVFRVFLADEPFALTPNSTEAEREAAGMKLVHLRNLASFHST